MALIIGFGPGGGYDLWGRTVARHIGKHLPGKPSVVPQNMPGAGSYRGRKPSLQCGAEGRHRVRDHRARRSARPAEWRARRALRRDEILLARQPDQGAQRLHRVNSTAAVKAAADLADKQLILGDTGPGTGTRSYPKVLSDLLGYKFKLVSGFRSSADVFLAMERGEVEGICESLDSVNQRKPDWIANKTVNVLLQAGDRPHPDLKGVPFVLDLARSAEERAVLDYLYAGQGIGRPFVAPPDLPPERLKMLRDAFDATMKDPDFVADAQRSKLDLEPEDGAHLAALIAKIYATPKPIIERVANLIK